MRKLLFVLSAMLILFSTQQAAAQELSKKERKAMEKEWKKKMKAVDPMDYKAMVEEQERLQNEAYDKGQKVTELETALATKDAKIQELEMKAANAKEMEVERKVKMEESMAQGPAMTKGLSYRVQVGAFRNKDLSKYTQNNPNFNVDKTDGMSKYTIGAFSDYWDADKFKVYLRAMGVRDAWVTAYKDGQRVSMQEAREGMKK